jgi:glycerophosphoryl diester phosphodiesterase
MRMLVACVMGGLLTAPLFAAVKKIEVQGHRGARSIKPENTLPAFQYALEQGVDTLELDLGVTKDGVVVVSHDPVISPMICLGPDGKAPAEGIAINTLTLAELKKFDCGTLKHPRFPAQQPVPGTPKPTLEEVFALVAASPLPAAKTVQFNIETKIVPREASRTPSPEVFAKLVVELVRKHKLEDRTVIQSFDHRSLVAVKKLAPKIRIAPLVGDSLPDWPALIKATKAEIISPNLNWITPDTVKAAQAAGARVIPWTANTAEEWDYLISCGVDGIITDDPAALIAHLKSKKLL